MSETPYMPLFVGDFLAKTEDLNDAETGAYMRLIMAQWTRKGRSLPDEQAKLQRIAHSGRNWPKVWAEIARFFDRDEDGYYNRTCREMFEKRTAQAIAKSISGARGGHAKALKMLAAPLANASNSPEQTPSMSQSYPEKEEESVFSTEKTLMRVLRFSEFWAAYPHRDGKRGRKLAEAKYRAAVKRGVSEQTIIDGAKRAHADPRVKAGYARDPTTWLNQAGWDDEIVSTVTPIRGGYTPEQQQARDAAFAAMVAKARQQ